jgi:prophage regulatory protein
MQTTVPARSRTAISLQPLAAADVDSALLRLPTVMALVALSKTSIYGLVARGEFPPPIRRGKRCTRWRASSVIAWLQAQGK